MLQCRIVVLSVIGVGESAVQRRFKLARKVSCPWNSFGGWRRRRGGVIVRSRRLLADRGGESIPIGNAKRLGDQFEA